MRQNCSKAMTGHIFQDSHLRLYLRKHYIMVQTRSTSRPSIIFDLCRSIYYCCWTLYSLLPPVPACVVTPCCLCPAVTNGKVASPLKNEALQLVSTNPAQLWNKQSASIYRNQLATCNSYFVCTEKSASCSSHVVVHRHLVGLTFYRKIWPQKAKLKASPKHN
jgi:hypothetical protein